MTPDKFGEKIKAKYPDYASIDNAELSRRIVAKHPEYASQVEFNDAPNDQMRKSSGSGEALLTNLPTRGFGQDLARGGPATVGALIGGVAGSALGPLGTVGGAALGGMAGEAVRQGVSNLTAAAFPEQNYPIASPRQVIGDTISQGVSQGAGAALGLGIGAAASALRPGANKIGAQVIRIGSGVPTEVGEAALRDPSMLLRAKPAAETGAKIGEYLGGAQAVERAVDPLTGAVSEVAKPRGLKYNVKGLQELMPGKFLASTGDKFNLVNDAMTKLGHGELGLQEALVVRQQASKMLSTPNFQNAELAAVKQEIAQALGQLDEFIEPQLPEMGGLRQAYRDSKVAEEFSNWLPLNRNSSPNVLRSVLATREAAMGAAAAIGVGGGSPIGLAALPLISPKFYGTAIKGAALLGKVPTSVYRVAPQAAAGARSSSIADFYGRLNRQIPEVDPSYQSIGGMRPANR